MQFIQCACGNNFEFVEGQVYEVKDDDGKKINKIAAKHMA